MRDQRTTLLSASAAMLTLILHQTALAEPPANNAASPSSEQPAQAASPAPAAAEPAPAAEAAAGASEATLPSTAAPNEPPTADAAPPARAEPQEAVNVQAPETAPAQHEAAIPIPPPPPPAMAEAHERMTQGHAQMMRERAMQRGVELPETPPWKLMNDEERQAHWEKMRNMTLEERRAMREQRWQTMRERAQEQGIDMPETPPWKQAEQRRAEMKARWESYGAILEAMTPEQKEAVQAIYGSGRRGPAPRAMGRMAPPVMPMPTFNGQRGACIPRGTGLPGFGYGGEQPMYPGPTQGWYGGDQGGFQAPPPPAAGFNQGW